MSSNDDLLRAIDAKLGALLAITVDQYLRDTGAAKPRHANVDAMLRAVGMSAKDIAALLGKTEQAVYAMLKAADADKGGGASRTKTKKGDASD